MANRIITISREFGSGGRTIGRKTAEKLGIHCYDSELIQKIAEESGYDAEYVKEESEDVSGGWFAPFISDRTMGLTNQDKLWTVQSKIILELAEKESCVIVGRCADYILRDKADCLKVFIYADPKKRAERIVTEYGETDVPPEQRIKEKDKRRIAYHNFYTDMKWGHAQNYHLCLDSGVIGIDECVEIIAKLY